MNSKKIYLLIFFFGLVFLVSCKKEKKLYAGYIDADYVYISAYEDGKLENAYVSKGQLVKENQILFATDKHNAEARLNTLKNLDLAIAFYVQDMQAGARQPKINTWKHLENALASMYEGSGLGYEMNKKLALAHAVAQENLWLSDHIHRAIGEFQKAAHSWTTYLSLSSERPEKIKTIENFKKALEEQITYYKWLVQQTVQRSPNNALVFDVLYRKGEFVQKGKPVVVLLPPENIKARFYLDGGMVNKVKIGSNVQIFVSGIKKPLNAKIIFISNKADYTEPYIYSLDNNKKLVYMVEAKFETKTNMHPGQPIEVKIN